MGWGARLDLLATTLALALAGLERRVLIAGLQVAEEAAQNIADTTSTLGIGTLGLAASDGTASEALKELGDLVATGSLGIGSLGIGTGVLGIGVLLSSSSGSLGFLALLSIASSSISTSSCGGIVGSCFEEYVSIYLELPDQETRLSE